MKIDELVLEHWFNFDCFDENDSFTFYLWLSRLKRHLVSVKSQQKMSFHLVLIQFDQSMMAMKA